MQAAQAEAEASAADAKAATDSILCNKLTARLSSLQEQLQLLEGTAGEQQQQAAACQQAQADAAAALAALQPLGPDAGDAENTLALLGRKAEGAAADAARQEALLGQLHQECTALAAQLAAAQQKQADGPKATQQRLEQQLQDQHAQAAAAAQQLEAARAAVGEAEAAWREANRHSFALQVHLMTHSCDFY